MMAPQATITTSLKSTKMASLSESSEAREQQVHWETINLRVKRNKVIIMSINTLCT